MDALVDVFMLFSKALYNWKFYRGIQINSFQYCWIYISN